MPVEQTTLQSVLELPRYAVAEAARYLHLPVSTLRSWVNAGPYSVAGTQDEEPLIARPEADDTRLSFSNLVEAHVLRSLRTTHRLSMAIVRRAIRDAEREYGIRRLLFSNELLAMPGSMFLQRLGQLIEISAQGQKAIHECFEAHLERVARTPEGIPFRLFPFARTVERPESPKVVVIDPKISFGRPIIDNGSIQTATIVERFDSGESILELAEDYDVTAEEIEEAIRYETWQRAA